VAWDHYEPKWCRIAHRPQFHGALTTATGGSITPCSRSRRNQKPALLKGCYGALHIFQPHALVPRVFGIPLLQGTEGLCQQQGCQFVQCAAERNGQPVRRDRVIRVCARIVGQVPYVCTTGRHAASRVPPRASQKRRSRVAFTASIVVVGMVDGLITRVRAAMGIRRLSGHAL